MIRQAPKAEEKERKVTYAGKEAIRCPVCDSTFHREELFTGRVNAGELTDELHRLYIPMHAWGEVQPLVYEMTVCPSCWYAASKADFAALPPGAVAVLSQETGTRIDAVQRLVPGVDFGSPRGLREGLASYYLALSCYQHFGKEAAPTVKQGIAALRASWLCAHLEAKEPGEDWDRVSRLFARKARFLYRRAVELEQAGKEPITSARWLGPDTDKNYGYEGVLYLMGILELKYGPRSDPARRAELLDSSKRAVAKLFGLGRRSKSKPGPLLDKARDFYDRVKAELKQADDDDE